MLAKESRDSQSTRDRKMVRLHGNLEKRLSAYAIAASVAGVGALATTNTAEARIIYTPAHTNIPVNSVLPLDLNHDGVVDFSVRNTRYSGGTNSAVVLSLGCAEVPASHSSTCRYRENDVWGQGFFSGRFASALPAGVTVGADKPYFRNAKRVLMGAFEGGFIDGSNTQGQWLYTHARYIGLQFIISGEIHYGWARVNVDNFNEVTLTGYAYETIPNKPIITGKTKGPDVITLEPASLGRLAEGTSGVWAWREKK